MSSIYSTNFYIYAYLREDGSPYYIGKGSAKRAWSKNHLVTVPKNKFKIVIMESNLTEIGAFSLERFYIRWYGRKNLNTGILRNLTDGGEGTSGRKFSNKHKQKISKSLSGKKFSDEHCKNISSSKKGHQSWLGKKHTEITKDKIRNSKIGSIVSEETRKKLSLSSKGKKIHNDEFKQNRKRMMLENNPAKKYKLSCIHCNKEMSKSNHTKWHGEKCKFYFLSQSETEIK